MAVSWFHPRDLPPVYRALLDPERELPNDVYLAASLPSYNVRVLATLSIVPISGFWVVYALQRLMSMGRFSDVIGILFWVISALVAGGAALKTMDSLRYAIRARVEHQRGRWRFGVFMHHDWLLIRHEANRTLLIPRLDVHRVTEEVSQNGKSIVPQIDLGDNSLTHHPMWQALWPQIEDANITDRMRDWFQGRHFRWYAGKDGYAPPSIPPESDDEGSDKPHMRSLPPQKLSQRPTSKPAPSPTDFMSLDSQPFLSPGATPRQPETPTLVPKSRTESPSQKPGPKRRVAPVRERDAFDPAPPTPMARDRIREVLAHTVQSTKLDLSSCRLSAVPSEILRAPQLTYLDLSNNNLQHIPAFVAQLAHLEVLDISGNPDLNCLPKSIGQLNNLRHIQADLTGFEFFPWEVSICKALNHLVLPGEPFNQRQRDEIISLLPYIRIEFAGASAEEENSINMPFRQLLAQAEAEQEAQSEMAINLSRQELTSLDIASLSHSRVVTINASHNQLAAIPSSISDMTQLQVLLLDNNRLKVLPESLCRLEHLEWLSITNNELHELPKNIAMLTNLSQLILYGNRFDQHEQDRIKATFPDLEVVF